MTLLLFANANRLAVVTQRTVEVEPPVYVMTSAACARSIHFLPPLFLATYSQGGNIGFCRYYSDFLLPFRSQTLVNCTSLDSLWCVVYFYNMLKAICAASKHLKTDKC